jgi:hypothetical protein
VADLRRTTRLRFWLWLIRIIGVIVPRRLRAGWRQEWEAELRHREMLLAEWDRLDWRHKLDLLWRSTSAFWDALKRTSFRFGRHESRRFALCCGCCLPRSPSFY